MMFLGLVFHTLASYTKHPLGSAWPYQDPKRSMALEVILMWIHLFRMPTFFIMAGFFSALLLRKNGRRGFLLNRTLRILLPLVLGYLFIVPLCRLGLIVSVHLRDHRAARLPDALVAAGKLPWSDYFGDQVAHLWFLSYLLWFYALATLWISLVSLNVRERLGAQLRSLFYSRFGPLLLTVLLSAPLCLMKDGVLATSLQLLPKIELLLAYGLFFVFGWLGYAAPDALFAILKPTTRRFLVSVPLCVVYAMTLSAAVKARQEGWGESAQGLIYRVATACLGAALTWSLSLAWMGLFVRLVQRARPWVRYLTDASYWVYLVHLPLVIALPGMFVATSLGVWSRVAAVLSITTIATVLSYALLVRGTFLGLLLNGRRVSPSRAAPLGELPNGGQG